MFEFCSCIPYPGIGRSMIFTSCYPVIGYYFKSCFSVAIGIMMSGSGIGTFIFAPLTEFLCSNYGWKGALLILSAIYANTIALGIMLKPTSEELINMAKLRNRRKEVPAQELSREEEERGSCSLPLSRRAKKETDEIIVENFDFVEMASQKRDTESGTWKRCCAPLQRTIQFFDIKLLWRNPKFGVVCLVTTLGSVGFYAHILYVVPRVVYDLNIAKADSASLLSAIGISSTISNIAYTPLIDRATEASYQSIN